MTPLSIWKRERACYFAPVTDIVCVSFLPPQNEHENDASKRDAEAKTRDSGKNAAPNSVLSIPLSRNWGFNLWNQKNLNLPSQEPLANVSILVKFEPSHRGKIVI